MKNKIFVAATATGSMLALVLGLAPVAMGQCLEDDRVFECEPAPGTCVGEMFIELAPSVSIDSVLAQYGLTLVDSVPGRRFHIVSFEQQNTDEEAFEDAVDALVAQMLADGAASRAEPHRNLETPEGVQLSIPDLGITADVQDYEQQPAAGTVRTTLAHARYTGAGVVVAIVDTGMAFEHPVTAEQIGAPGADFAGGDGTARAQPNQTDDDGDSVVDESLHHATFVAGLVHLAAPQARILPVRALETDGKGTVFGVADAIRYAIAHGADVINLSQSMLHDARDVEDAIELAADLGIVVVAAAGNRGEGGVPLVDDTIEDGCQSFPAYRDEVIAVAAVDQNGVKAPFSDYGPDVDISAPGVDLLSTFDVDFAGWSGTSFAAPLVAGAAALILEKYPCMTPDEVRDLLMQTAQPDNNPTLVGQMGAGVLDLDALTQALRTDRCSLRVDKSPSGSVLRWTPVLDATHYDAVRGDVAQLALGAGPIVDLGPLACLVENSVATDTSATPDGAQPNPGEVHFYLFRDNLDPSYGAGGYYTGPRVPGPGDCSSGP
jgi:subtilisin family serine protease